MSTPSYASTAYSPASLQHQQPAKPRSGLKRLVGRRLPWGNTQSVVPVAFMEPGPDSLRLQEELRFKKVQEQANGTYKPAPLEHIDFHDRCDHEHYRHSPWAKRTNFWVYLATFGKGFFFMFLLLGFLAALTSGFLNRGGFIENFTSSFQSLFLIIGLPSLLAWGLASLVIHKFPRLWAKPGKGPKWELNRRTGMITVFKYQRSEITEQRAPFHEFDAYINTTPDRQGLPMNVLSVEHRYSDISIHFGDIQPPDRNVEELCALWDFIQNYMDTSHPLPDAPLFEEHRHNDPTTGEYDKKSGRNPRYWIDMDDDTFAQEKSQMRARVGAINTFTRPNLMARFVEYN